MSKKLDTSAIQRDLEGSAFFPRRPRPVPTPPTGPVPILPEQEASRDRDPVVHAPGRAYARTPVRRKLVRHPFEFYEDQVAELRRISLEAQLRGEKTSMSEIVRNALDEYLQTTAGRK